VTVQTQPASSAHRLARGRAWVQPARAWLLRIGDFASSAPSRIQRAWRVRVSLPPRKFPGCGLATRMSALGGKRT